MAGPLKKYRFFCGFPKPPKKALMAWPLLEELICGFFNVLNLFIMSFPYSIYIKLYFYNYSYSQDLEMLRYLIVFSFTKVVNMKGT